MSDFKRVVYEPLLPEDQVQNVEAIVIFLVDSFKNGLAGWLPQSCQVATKQSRTLTWLVHQEGNYLVELVTVLGHKHGSSPSWKWAHHPVLFEVVRDLEQPRVDVELSRDASFGSVRWMILLFGLGILMVGTMVECLLTFCLQERLQPQESSISESVLSDLKSWAAWDGWVQLILFAAEIHWDLILFFLK